MCNMQVPAVDEVASCSDGGRSAAKRTITTCSVMVEFVLDLDGNGKCGVKLKGYFLIGQEGKKDRNGPRVL